MAVVAAVNLGEYTCAPAAEKLPSRGETVHGLQSMAHLKRLLGKSKG